MVGTAISLSASRHSISSNNPVCSSRKDITLPALKPVFSARRRYSTCVPVRARSCSLAAASAAATASETVSDSTQNTKRSARPQALTARAIVPSLSNTTATSSSRTHTAMAVRKAGGPAAVAAASCGSK